MTSILRGLAVLAVASGLFSLHAATDDDSKKTDAPLRPQPRWLKNFVDQGEDDAALKGYVTPEGIKVDIVADFPVVTNPVGMTFAEDGTLFVIEWRPDPKPVTEENFTVTYKDGSTRTFAATKKSVKDVVKVLRDTKGKGVYDQSEVILEEELPSSLLALDGWLYVSGRGTLRRYKVADLLGKGAVKEGEAKPKPEVIARGFGGTGHGQVSGMALGPGGWLYVTVGTGDHVVEGSDGGRAIVLGDGAIFRCRPDGSRMHVHSVGYKNPYREVTFDVLGNAFHIDNGRKTGAVVTGCRLIHVVEDGDFGVRTTPIAPAPPPDKPKDPASEKNEKNDKEVVKPIWVFGKLPPMLDVGRGAAAGLLCYNETRLPEAHRGLLYFPDLANKRIAAFKVEPKGASFEVVEAFDLVKAEDPLFRPCQAVVGPDGAIYVCDWRTNSTGSGQFSGDGKHGRIYRLRWEGNDDQAEIALRGSDSWAKVSKLADAELLKALASEDQSDRQVATREAVRRGEKLRPALVRILAWPHLDEKQRNEGDGKDLVKDEPHPFARVAALSALESLWDDSVREALLKVMRDPEATVRRLAFDALGRNARPGDSAVTEALLQQLEEPAPAARRAVFLALGRIGGGDAADGLVNTFKSDPGKDAVLTDGLLRAVERAGKPGIAKLVALAESGDEKDHDRVLDIFVGLRTRPAAEAIPGLLKYPHLTIRQRVDLLRSFGDYRLEPALSLEPVVDYLTANADAPPGVKLAGLEVLSHSPALRSEKGQKLVVNLFDDSDPVLRKSGIAVLGSRPEGARLAAELLLAKKLPAELREPIAAALRRHADKDKEAKRLLVEVEKGS